MKRTLGLAVLATLVLGSGSAGGGTASGLAGRVMRGPTQPVCRAGASCEAPARGVKLTFFRSGTAVGSATTDKKGYYRVALTPGPYAVRTNRPGFERVPQPSHVSVASNRFKRVNFHIDTGIR
jgi:Carboxypeptidase regulatory-like domain